MDTSLNYGKHFSESEKDKANDINLKTDIRIKDFSDSSLQSSIHSSNSSTETYSLSSSFTYSKNFGKTAAVTKVAKKNTHDIENETARDQCINYKRGAITLALMGGKLWKDFMAIGTEMIINRNGRRMFPFVEFSLRGLDPTGIYDVMFEIIPASNNCFKFINNTWIPVGKKDQEHTNMPYMHPDSPANGSDWMTRKISFEKIKLSNKTDFKHGIVTLHTQQKYMVKITVLQHSSRMDVILHEFPLPDTTFITSTAYNNREVTKLKIISNPYSKGFRFPVKRYRKSEDAPPEHDGKKQKFKVAENKKESVDVGVQTDDIGMIVSFGFPGHHPVSYLELQRNMPYFPFYQDVPLPYNVRAGQQRYMHEILHSPSIQHTQLRKESTVSTCSTQKRKTKITSTTGSSDRKDGNQLLESTSDQSASSKEDGKNAKGESHRQYEARIEMWMQDKGVADWDENITK